MNNTSPKNWIHPNEEDLSPNRLFFDLNNSLPQPPLSLRSSKGINKISSPRTYVPSRPPLLHQIEEFLQQNLEKLALEDTTSITPQTEDWLANKRLKIYRDAFSLYINEFNIYKPFLLAVKHEYETVLDYFSIK